MAHEWRDLFSSDFLSNWMGKVQRACAGNSTDPGALTAAQDSEDFVDLLNLCGTIHDYHQVPKNDVKKLDKRRSKLKNISRKAGRLLKKMYYTPWIIAARKTHNFQESADQPVSQRYSYDEQNIGRIILSIQRRALRKAGYLKLLKAYYSDKKNRDVDLVKKLLGAPRDMDTDLLEVQQGVRLERIDPVHRPFELVDDELVKDEHGSVVGIGAVARDTYAFHFREWFNKESAVPFFMYLEMTPFCLGDDKYAVGNVNMTKVSYSNLHKRKIDNASWQTMIEICVPSQQLLWSHFPENSRKQEMITDTGKYTGKGQKGYAAYAFSEHYELFLAQHKEGEWHHTSFMAGAPVRCAGMIFVKMGKVKVVTDHSGHYMPGRRHLYNFVLWLNSKGVLAQDCKIKTHGSNGQDATWQDFLANRDKKRILS